MIKYGCLLLVFFFLTSCNTDRKLTSSSLYLKIENHTGSVLFVKVFPPDRGYGNDSIWFSLDNGEIYYSDPFVSEDHLVSSIQIFNPQIYPVYFVDSAQVIFADSLDIIHYSRVIPFDSLTSSSKPLFYLEQRNIFNFDNYSVQKVGEYNFEATYIFTEADLHYADSIHQ